MQLIFWSFALICCASIVVVEAVDFTDIDMNDPAERMNLESMQTMLAKEMQLTDGIKYEIQIENAAKKVGVSPKYRLGFKAYYYEQGELTITKSCTVEVVFFGPKPANVLNNPTCTTQRHELKRKRSGHDEAGSSRRPFN